MRQRLRNYAVTQPQRQWFKIVNQAGMPAQVMIYDEIGFFGVSAQAFADQLGDITGPIDLYINSPGGEIFDGISIYNQLLRCQDVSVYIDGIAASAASFIAQAASPGKLGMAKNAKMMIHNGQAFAAGDAAELRKMAELLDSETANIASIYAERTGRPASDFLAMMDSETWLSASQSVTEGLADYVYDPRKGPSNVIQVRPVNSGNGGWVSRDGKWVFDPDGDGDNDATPEGDTDHDYFAEDGTQKKAIPPDPDGKQGKPMPTAVWSPVLVNADKYKQDERDKMAKSGEAMPDGSYPVADEEDLSSAILAVGRGGADHDAIRRHVITRAAALGKSSMIPDNWAPDGSLKTSSAEDQIDVTALSALFSNALKEGTK
jgi:ATP-dependent Clp endopeptidase proteolytic subunit ClpP